MSDVNPDPAQAQPSGQSPEPSPRPSGGEAPGQSAENAAAQAAAAAAAQARSVAAARRRRAALRAVQNSPAPDAPSPETPDAPAATAPEAPAAEAPAAAPAASARPAAPRPPAGEHGPAEAPAPQPRPRPRFRSRAATPSASVTIPAADMQAAPVAPPAARVRLRHWMMLASFVLLVLVPFGLTAAYLYGRAADQYHSELAYSIRSEESASAAAGLIGAITNLGTGSASDTDILFEYIRSQGIVEIIDREIDLRTIYNRAEGDPVFTLGPDASIEALVAFWRRMVRISFETGAGIIHVEARAFTPEDARAISTAILRHSSELVNKLSEQARSDAVRFAQEEQTAAEAALQAMRAKLSDFRRENRIVDPSGDVAGQAGLLNALQSELAQALVERDMLSTYADEGDQRMLQANRRIDAIGARIEAERASLGVPGQASALPEVVGRYEELLVDLQFANTAYTQALANLAAARAESRRQSRYLAPHVQPTRAESALYPRRALLAGLTLLFLTLGWSIGMLVYYNVRDNR
jgi:capsular polysaccharide transport system permease protein